MTNSKEISKRPQPLKNVIVLALLLTIGFSTSGCFYLVLTGVAAAGGYAISPDTIQGETERDFDQVWDAAVEVVSIMGTISSQSRELGKITALVNNSKITLNVIQLTTSSVRLKVKARKAFLPSLPNAQNVYVKVINRVNQ